MNEQTNQTSASDGLANLPMAFPLITAGKLVSSHPNTLRAAIKRGELRAFLNGNKFLTTKQWLAEWLESRG